jgi:hypothetical protein
MVSSSVIRAAASDKSTTSRIYVDLVESISGDDPKRLWDELKLLNDEHGKAEKTLAVLNWVKNENRESKMKLDEYSTKQTEFLQRVEQLGTTLREVNAILFLNGLPSVYHRVIQSFMDKPSFTQDQVFRQALIYDSTKSSMKSVGLGPETARHAMLLMTMKKAIMQMIGVVEKTVKVPKIEDMATREARNKEAAMVVARKASITTTKRKEGLQSENLRAKSMSTIGNSIQMTLLHGRKILRAKVAKRKDIQDAHAQRRRQRKPRNQRNKLTLLMSTLSMTSNGTRKMITTVMIMILILMILTLQCHHLHLHPLHCHLVIT